MKIVTEILSDRANPVWVKIRVSNYHPGSFILSKIRKCYQANLSLLKARGRISLGLLKR